METPTGRAAKPVPVPDAVTAPYWQAAAEGRLSLQHCAACDLFVFPPKPRCPTCLSDELRWTDLSGRGRLHSHCTMHGAFVAGFEPPYVIGVTELDEQAGLRLSTNLIDCPAAEIRIDMAVEVAFEQRTDAIAIPQFRPARPAS